jgi:hypothetical protein
MLVFPIDPTYWRAESRRTQTTRPGADGQFVVRELPPGEYFIAALTDLAPSDTSDPVFLERIAGAALRFTLAPGEKKTQDFRVGSR